MLSEKAVQQSFRKVKEDIVKIHAQLLELSSRQIEIVRILQDIRGKEIAFEEKTEGEFYVASKNGKSFHIASCPLVKNISASNRLTFDSKKQAVKEGYKQHLCVK